MKLFENEKLLLTVLIVFSASLFIIGLGKMPLTDPDEVFYAETAKEMLNRGEFLTQYIFGEPQFEKPPLYYWLIIIFYKIFGVNEFSSRIASSLLGILGVIGVYLLGKTLMSKRAGFFSGFALSTSVIYLALSRACVTDILLLVTVLYAFFFFFKGYLENLGKTKWYLLSAFCFGLAVLTKGPVGIFLPVVIIGLFLIFTKDIMRIKEMPIIMGVIVFLAVALPWYLLMYKVHGKAFVDVFFGFHNITRFLHPEHRSGDIIYYYIPIIIAGFAPWTAFLPLGIWQMGREYDKRIKKTNIFLIIWFFVIFLFFTASRTKLPTYIFPLFPVLALMTGRVWDVFLAENFTYRMKKCMKWSIYLFLLVIVGGMVALYLLTLAKYPTVSNQTLITSIFLLIFMIIFATLLSKRKYIPAISSFMVAFLLLVFPISYIILAEIGRYESSKEISAKVLTLMKPTEELGAETQYRRGVAFYTNREDIPDIHKYPSMVTFLRKKERVWGIIKEKNHIQLYTDPNKHFTTPTYVVYKFGKKIIVTNKMPPDGKFIKLRTENDPY